MKKTYLILITAAIAVALVASTLVFADEELAPCGHNINGCKDAANVAHVITVMNMWSAPAQETCYAWLENTVSTACADACYGWSC